jgi:RNA polymerase sigma factor (sigma-70 family)
MVSSGSVTSWISQLKAGDEAALDKLHQRYWRALVGLARGRLKGAPCRVADEEDIAQDAFWSFYRTLRAGKLPQLENRHDLLALLSHITACKAINYLDRELGTRKRGSGHAPEPTPLECLAQQRERSPVEEALLDDCYQYYLDGLPPNLREVAVLYLAGLTQQEMAQRLGCVERTVQRKLPLILRRWQQMAEDSMSYDAAVSG